MTITTHAPFEAKIDEIDAAPIDALESLSDELDQLMMLEEIDHLDAQIVALVRRRVEITRRAGLARVGAGLPEVTRHAEMGVLRRFEAQLGRDGVSLGMLLIRLGRTGLPGRGK